MLYYPADTAEFIATFGDDALVAYPLGSQPCRCPIDTTLLTQLRNQLPCRTSHTAVRAASVPALRRGQSSANLGNLVIYDQPRPAEPRLALLDAPRQPALQDAPRQPSDLRPASRADLFNVNAVCPVTGAELYNVKREERMGSDGRTVQTSEFLTKDQMAQRFGRAFTGAEESHATTDSATSIGGDTQPPEESSQPAPLLDAPAPAGRDGEWDPTRRGTSADDAPGPLVCTARNTILHMAGFHIL